MNKADRIIVALDTDDLKTARKWVGALSGSGFRFKIGSQLFTAAGHDAVKMVHDAGGKVFLDLKYHDIPNTVASAVRSALKLGVWMLNVHTMGGRKMMEEAALAAREGNIQLIGVTILTSMKQTDLHALGISCPLEEQVNALALLAKASGLNGVVASAAEVKMIKKTVGGNFLVVTPGIRPSWASKDDQARIDTPKEALASGADYLVIGRPITHADDPKTAADRLLSEI